MTSPAEPLDEQLHALLAHHADPDGHVVVSRYDIAEHLDVATERIGNAIRHLVASRDIDVVRVGGTRELSEYRVLRQP